ncbi:MAG: NRDE family protein [Gammaproteobacteria bacterium]|nr:NRDE family protein [Gammaproteobacteria bacterium]
MCLILFAWRQHRDYPLVLIANRDEYYARPTRDAHWWDESPVFAGRDLEAGGTWLGVNRRGSLAAVTNVREPGAMKPGNKSRGALTQNFLSGDATPEAYLQELTPNDRDYAGFNLLLGDAQGLWFYSNRDHGVRSVDPGVYGISNGTFDEPWPKLSSGKQELAAMLDGEINSTELMAILTDHQVAEDHELPQTGVSLDVERMLSSRFIRSPEYGTRACSVVTIGADKQINFSEQNYPDAEHVGNLVQETFEITT